VEEIIWIGVVILWMIGAAQRGAKRKAEREAGMEAGLDTADASPTKQKPDWRDRILEAAKEWEAEQRRPAGELPGLPEGTRLEPEELPREARRSHVSRRGSVVVRDVTPDRTAVAGRHGRGVAADRSLLWEEEPAAPDLPLRAEPRAVARRRERDAPAPAPRRVPTRVRPRTPHTHATRSAHAGATGEYLLARLEHYPPLQRAIVLTQVLGPPKGLEEEAGDPSP
jgi:hypothetical protein